MILVSPFDKVSVKYKAEPKKAYSPEYLEALYLYSPYLLYRIIWLEINTDLSRKEILELKWSDDLSRFNSSIQLFISLLPKRSEYILTNRKGKKVDRNLVRHRLKVFEERFLSLVLHSLLSQK